MDRHLNKDLGEVSEGVLEEMRLCSEGDRERDDSFLRRVYNSTRDFIGRNKLPVSVLGIGHIMDGIGSYAFLHNGDSEVHLVSNYLISKLGNEAGVALVSLSSFTLISLLAAGVKNIAVNRFGEDTKLKNIDRTIMYLGGISRIYAGIDHFWPNWQSDLGYWLGR